MLPLPERPPPAPKGHINSVSTADTELHASGTPYRTACCCWRLLVLLQLLQEPVCHLFWSHSGGHSASVTILACPSSCMVLGPPVHAYASGAAAAAADMRVCCWYTYFCWRHSLCVSQQLHGAGVIAGDLALGGCWPRGICLLVKHLSCLICI
jgi:hypothetical protein